MAEYNLNLEKARGDLRQAQASVDAQAHRILRMKQIGASCVEAEKTLNDLADARDAAVARIRKIDPSRT
jgi:hypothetical protein